MKQINEFEANIFLELYEKMYIIPEELRSQNWTNYANEIQLKLMELRENLSEEY